MWIAAEGGFEPYWSERILEETGSNLVDRDVIEPKQWNRLRSAMATAFPDATLDQAAIDAIEDQMPNHEKDRHVLAAAVIGDVELVLTKNLRHFKAEDLARVGRRSLDPDTFLCELLGRSPIIARAALDQQAAHMRQPHQWTLAELLGCLGGLGAGDPLTPNLVAELERQLRLKPAPPP